MKHGMLTTNWAFELGFSSGNNDHHLFWFDTYTRYKGDHRGFFLCAGIYKLKFECNIYDIRHEYEDDWNEYACEYYDQEEYY
jgi:hypothetical protein